MILKAATARLKMILAGVAGAVAIALVVTIVWLWHSRENLLEINAAQAAAINNVVQANADNLGVIDGLIQDATRRDQKAIERQQREQRLSQRLSDTKANLHRALQDAPDCIDQPWPDAVFDIMRRNTVRDPDSQSAGEYPSGVSAADDDTGAGG